ncbi:Uncharacterised protein [Mycobacteroides abscessus subsp. massiliense]|nr:Uncharacterised protein [Mycobacteroides abscessus subsp. massiliense]
MPTITSAAAVTTTGVTQLPPRSPTATSRALTISIAPMVTGATRDLGLAGGAGSGVGSGRSQVKGDIPGGFQVGGGGGKGADSGSVSGLSTSTGAVVVSDWPSGAGGWSVATGGADGGSVWRW